MPTGQPALAPSCWAGVNKWGNGRQTPDFAVGKPGPFNRSHLLAFGSPLPTTRFCCLHDHWWSRWPWNPARLQQPGRIDPTSSLRATFATGGNLAASGLARMSPAPSAAFTTGNASQALGMPVHRVLDDGQGRRGPGPGHLLALGRLGGRRRQRLEMSPMPPSALTALSLRRCWPPICRARRSSSLGTL